MITSFLKFFDFQFFFLRSNSSWCDPFTITHLLRYPIISELWLWLKLIGSCEPVSYQHTDGSSLWQTQHTTLHLYLLFRYFSISKSCVYGVAQALYKKQLLLVNNPQHQKHFFCATIFSSLANDQLKEYHKTVVGCPSTRDSRCEHGKSTYFSRALQNGSSNNKTSINQIN